jgi:hypothetical protein
MNTPTDHRTIALQKLADLAFRRSALKQLLAPFETQIAAIQKGCTEATAADATAIEHLEEELKQMALTHGMEIFGKEARSLTHGLFMLAVRPTAKVEFAGDEEEILGVLAKAAKDHPDMATRLAAAACLRVKTDLNKVFVRDNWEAFAAWFTVFGLKLTESESASVVEKKPAKPRAGKPKTKVTEELEQEAA